MRRFHSYGPVDCEEHFCVLREEMVQRCVDQLVGKPKKSGHFFTIWGARQTGKTWLMRRAKQEIENAHPDRFLLGMISCQGVILSEDSPPEEFLKNVPDLMLNGFRLETEPPANWEGWARLFHKSHGLFDRPVILLIDEFDSLPPKVIDQLVTLFRNVYLERENYFLHGLALIGVRAVLGVDSLRGSPFNVQRSLHVPNLTRYEVTEMFRQYQAEGGQPVEPEVVAELFRVTRGQPGLVGWFGELLTETYNPGPEQPIRRDDWDAAYHAAKHKEWNNTLLNLIKKAQGPYADQVLALFTDSEMPFTIRAEWCAFLYLNGIIDEETVIAPNGERLSVCRFSSPFVQECLFDAFTGDMVGHRFPVLALDPLDDLADVFAGPELDVPSLLERYKAFLKRLAAKGLNPWKDQPRRADLALTEAVGHFHLYAWLQNVLFRRCAVSPEFPTGNGRVDLHLRCMEKTALLEVKSFRNRSEIQVARQQAAGYARNLGFSAIAIALFVPVTDESVLEALSGAEEIGGVNVVVVAIGWA